MVDGQVFHRLHPAWQWDLVANRVAEPTAKIPRPRSEPAGDAAASVVRIRPVASA